VPVVVECEGSLVAWDFRLTAGKDVGFSVEFEDSSSTKRPMLPYHRYEAHQGNFCSPSIGTYKLIWDNTYSNFYRKVPDNNIVSSNLKFEVFIVLSMLLTCSKQIVALVFPFMCGLEVSQNPIKPRFLQFFLLLSEASKWLRSFYKAIL
jgi:hypothetical protein